MKALAATQLLARVETRVRLSRERSWAVRRDRVLALLVGGCRCAAITEALGETDGI
jgi:hypothetical protein